MGVPGTALRSNGACLIAGRMCSVGGPRPRPGGRGGGTRKRRQRGGEEGAGHGNEAAEQFVVDQGLAGAFLDAGLGGDEAGGHDDGGTAIRLEAVDDVLDEEQVDRHLVFVLVRDLGDACKEALFVALGVELVAVVGEVELEGGI